MPLPFVAGALIATSIPILIKVFVALGIGIVTYTGADFAVTSAQTFLNNQLTGMPADAYAVLVLAGLDEGVKIIFAAMVANIGIKTTLGAFKKISFS